MINNYLQYFIVLYCSTVPTEHAGTHWGHASVSGDHHGGGSRGNWPLPPPQVGVVGKHVLSTVHSKVELLGRKGPYCFRPVVNLVLWAVSEYRKEPTLHLQVPNALKAILAVIGLNCLDYLPCPSMYLQTGGSYLTTLPQQSWLGGSPILFGGWSFWWQGCLPRCYGIKGQSCPFTINCGTVEWGDRWKAQATLVWANVQNVGVGTLRHFQPFLKESITHGLQWPLYEGATEIVQLQASCKSVRHFPSVNSNYLNHSVEHHQSSSQTRSWRLKHFCGWHLIVWRIGAFQGISQVVDWERGWVCPQWSGQGHTCNSQHWSGYKVQWLST